MVVKLNIGMKQYRFTTKSFTDSDPTIPDAYIDPNDPIFGDCPKITTPEILKSIPKSDMPPPFRGRVKKR